MAKAPAARNGTKPHAGKDPSACYVLSLSIENVRCFGPKQTLDLSDKNGRHAPWTIILGENGTGKTTLLQSLICVEPVDPPATANPPLAGSVPRLVHGWWNPSRPSILDIFELGRTVSEDNPASCEVSWKYERNHKSIGGLDIGGTAFWKIYPSRCTFENEAKSLHLYAFGAGRRLGRTSLSSNVQDDSAGTLFLTVMELGAGQQR